MSSSADKDSVGGSLASRGGAGAFIEGELGAYYLLSMLAGIEPRGMPGCKATRVRFQGTDEGYALDDLIIHSTSAAGNWLLEIQSKRTVKFSPKDVVFKEVCGQIAKVSPRDTVAEERHLLAVATQRTSFRICGPYQDALAWARAVDSGAAFFHRLNAKGVAGPEMREFVDAFRKHLVEASVSDDDEIIWKLLRRFHILEFDFESSAPQARAFALFVAESVLAPEDTGRAQTLWDALIACSLSLAKVGGSIDGPELRNNLIDGGFRFSNQRDWSMSHAKMNELSKHALAEMGQSVAGVQLPRSRLIAEVDNARDAHRFVEVRGSPGVGKSAVLKQIAERTMAEARALVLDPIGTPAGGWSALAQRLGVNATAHEFFSDIAAAGGGVLFIDSLEMFVDAGRIRTVNDVLREISRIDGFSVFATSRTGYGDDGDDWLAEDALNDFGSRATVEVGELEEAEVSALCDQAPELGALLAPDHPAAPIARNLYRLSRLLKVADPAGIRTEAALAVHWWKTGDGIGKTDRRAAQRLFSDIVEGTFAGSTDVLVASDSSARAYLLGSSALRETRRDHLTFSHDILRDWAIGMKLHEEPELFERLDVTKPVPRTVARGLEFAGRIAIEASADSAKAWLALLGRVSTPSAHASWRRNVLLALVRSELAATLLDRHSELLLNDGGEELAELCDVVAALDSFRLADMEAAAGGQSEISLSLPRSIRAARSASSAQLLLWCCTRADRVPARAMLSIAKLGEQLLPFNVMGAELTAYAARAFYQWLSWLEKSDDDAAYTQAHGKFLSGDQYRAATDRIRALCLVCATLTTDEIKNYLNSITSRDDHRLNQVRRFSKAVSFAAPAEFAALIERSLIGTGGHDRHGPMSIRDSDYLPPSPAQPPFLDLLEADRSIGLSLIRKLTQRSFEYHGRGIDPEIDGYKIDLPAGERFFPLQESYLWSRGQAPEYSVGSCLKALEAWAHRRIEAKEPIESIVLAILGPEGSCAAFLLVAVDVLLSHWPDSRESLMPFVSSPHLLVADHQRASLDQIGAGNTEIGDEPSGSVRLIDLRQRPSRSNALESVLEGYSTQDSVAVEVRRRLCAASETLGPPEDDADYNDSQFMAFHAVNLIDGANWEVTGEGKTYNAPPKHAEHLRRLHARSIARQQSLETEALISLATSDRKTYGSPQTAARAMAYEDATPPDTDDGEDHFRSRALRTISTAMLVARDGDDMLLDDRLDWVRTAIEHSLDRPVSRVGGSNLLVYSQSGLAANALIHLWARKRQTRDRDQLLNVAWRDDDGGSLAVDAALTEIVDADPRLSKSLLRIALGCCVRRRNRRDNSAQTYEEWRNRGKQAVAAEIAWLDGAGEPSWPDFPEERPRTREPIRIGFGDKDFDAVDAPKEAPPDPLFRVDHQTAAKWLDAVLGERNPDSLVWVPDLVAQYAGWTARANGHGQDVRSEFHNVPSEWNDQFYKCVARVVLDGDPDAFGEHMQLIEELPDRAYVNVANSMLFAADVTYFNDRTRSADRAVELRNRVAQHVSVMPRWHRYTDPGALRVDSDSAPLIAKIFFNIHSPFQGTRTYLVPSIFERVDPLLAPLRQLLRGGPTSFIAICVMNTLGVRFRPEHAEFLITAVEEWFICVPEPTMWVQLGIGSQVIEWLERTSDEDASLLGNEHPLRGRIDAVVGRLVQIGIPEAYEYECRVEHSQSR